MLSEKRDKMLARISRLAKKYGPFVRFYPDGSEEHHEETPVGEDGTPEGDGTALDSAIKTSEAAAKTPEEQAEIDKARKNEQQIEQERANAERANEVAKQAQTDLETAKAANEQLQEQLADAEAKAAAAGITDVTLKEDDFEGTDVQLVKSINALKQKLEASNKRSATLEKKAKGYEQQAQQDAVIAARNTAYEELLSDLDKEYGVDCRNAAVEKFQELTKSGKVPKGNPAKATRIMEKCYKEVKAAKKAKPAKDKSSLSLDSGLGGGFTPSLSGVEVKEGSLDEVAEQYGKALANRKS